MDGHGNRGVRPNTGAFRFEHSDPLQQIFSVLSARGGLNRLNQHVTMQMMHNFPQREQDINAIAARLFEMTPANASTPTDSTVLSSLTEQPLSAEDVEVNPTDAIDMDDFAVGDMAIKLPCKHAFKKENITTWLKDHNTCPVCRHTLQASSTPSAASGDSAAAAAGGGDTAQGPDNSHTEHMQPPFGGFMSLMQGMLGEHGSARAPQLPVRGSSQVISFQTGPRGTRIPRGVHPVLQPHAPSQSSQDEDAQLQAAIQASLAEEASRQSAAASSAAQHSAQPAADAAPGGGGGDFEEVQALIRSSLSALTPEEVMQQAQREGIRVAGKTRRELEDLIVGAMMGEAHATVLTEEGAGATHAAVEATAPPAAAASGGGSSVPSHQRSVAPSSAAAGGQGAHGAGGLPFSDVYPPVQPGCNEYILTVQLPQQLQLVLGFPADASLGQVYSTVWGLEGGGGHSPTNMPSSPTFKLIDEHSGEELKDFGLQLQESRLPREGGSLVVVHS